MALVDNFIFKLKNKVLTTKSFLRKWKWLSTSGIISVSNTSLIGLINLLFLSHNNVFESLWNSLPLYICKENWKSFPEYIFYSIKLMGKKWQWISNLNQKEKRKKKLKLDLFKAQEIGENWIRQTEWWLSDEKSSLQESARWGKLYIM